ncbi:MAG TPA: glycosyltransferase [Miltoncostaea sp.]|nr:glycosyltransferase [Miltoncostaea sp.]
MTADGRVAANGAVLADMERRVTELAAAGDDALAAAWAQVASDFAWNSPPGVHASPAIDDALEAIGLRHVPRGPRTPRGDGPERVLHVITECAAVGGHSRMAWRWIERDEDRLPTLALTRHRADVPAPLARALEARGGRAVPILGHDLIDRARALGALVDAHDLVVLHIHPMEVAASIALADRDGRPPVLFVNHADHCFWLAPRVPDLVVSSRPAAARLCEVRRGVHPDRSALLPVPAEPAAAPPPRDAARRALGLADDAVAMVAMASAYKLAAIDDIGFADLVEPVIAAAPAAQVLVVGPDDDGPWADARARTGGRLRALGRLDDPSGVLAAADVFLDAYPCSSLTAALEAAALGIPVVSYAPPRPQAATYDIDEPALADVHVVARGRDAHLTALRDLAADPAARAALGARTAEAAAAMHDRGRWRADLEAAYDRARVCAAEGPLAGAAPVADAGTAHEDAFLLALHEASGLALSPAGALLRNGDAFPCDPRRGLTVVVHCRDDAEGLMHALGSAVETLADLDDVEAVVIDDASGPATAAVIDGLRGDVRVVRNAAPLGPQASFAGALELATGEAALLMTADVVLLPGWLDPLADALARPGVSGAAPTVLRGSGREVCVLTSVASARAGAAVVALSVPESAVRAAPAGAMEAVA